MNNPCGILHSSVQVDHCPAKRFKTARLLDTIKLPEDLHSASSDLLEQLCSELRDEIISVTSRTGGHLASNLGVVELTVALHQSFYSPFDKIIWDVGHQSYIHKMLTGRCQALSSIRQQEGLSGFPMREESIHDIFGAGHAGTSVSAAVGIATALKQKNTKGRVIAVIGDGAFSSGMVFEGLNHAGDLALDNLIVILNDNGMSIDPNVGALTQIFSGNDHSQQDIREKLFKAFGFSYLGPIDGHNLSALRRNFSLSKNTAGPILLHVRTTKGKGFLPAEKNPSVWHGISPFKTEDPAAAKHTESKVGPKKTDYSSIFGQALTSLAKSDPRIVGITAGMPQGSGLSELKQQLPASFFDVGICEAHAVTFAAGLACQGYSPVCAIYSSFLQRSLDQIIHDVCIQNLPVTFAVDRAGLVGNDGVTHQGVFDIAFLRCLPNLTLMSPCNAQELKDMLFTAVKLPGPTIIRYPRASVFSSGNDLEPQKVETGKFVFRRRGSRILLLAYGPTTQQALQAADLLAAKGKISISVASAIFAKPLDEHFIRQELPKYELICTVEDHALAGGFSSGLLERINDLQLKLRAPIKRFGVSDTFISHASQKQQIQQEGYDSESIYHFIRRFCLERSWPPAKILI